MPSWSVSSAGSRAAGGAFGHGKRAPDEALSKISKFIEGAVGLGEEKRDGIRADLLSVGDGRTPEKFMADSAVRSGIMSLVTLPLIIIHPALALIGPAVGAVMFFRAPAGLSKKAADRREKIEFELTGLASHIEKRLRHDRDVIGMLDSYRQYAGEELRDELTVTVADMKSGSYEEALTRLEARVGSSMMSDTVRGLLGILRGDDSSQYFRSLIVKFTDYGRQILKRKALKVPGRVRKLSMALLVCFLVMYLVVIVVQITESLGGMFSL